MDKKKKRPKSSVRAADAVEADDWAPYTAPDGRVYYYNQVTKESRWKLPKSKKKKHQEPSVPVQDEPVALQPVEDTARRHRHRNGSSKKDAAQEEPVQTESRHHKRRGSSKADKGDEASSMRSRVQLLQASLAGRIGNPMGPRPAQIKIPTSSESEDQGESSQSFLFGAGSMPVQDEYKAETAHMSAAERLRYLRRKRQEATLTKEKSVLDDGFMQEFTRNMKQKESNGGGSRSQAAAKRWKEQEEAEQERKRLQLLEEQERKRQENAEREVRELAKEIAEEEERQREKDAEEKRKRKEKPAEEEFSLSEKEIEENRLMEDKCAEEERLQQEKEAEERKKTDEAEEEQHQEEKDAEAKDEKRRHEEEEAVKVEQEESAIPPVAGDDEESERKREKEKRRERRRKENEAAMRMADEAAVDIEQAIPNEVKESNDSEVPNKRRSRKHEQHEADTASDENSHDLDQLSIVQENRSASVRSEKSQEKPRKSKKKAQHNQDPVDEEPLDDSRKSMHLPGSYPGHSHEYHSHIHEQHVHGGHRCLACEQNAATMGLTTMPYPPPMPYGGMCACGYPAAGVPYAVALPPPPMAYYGYPPPPPPMQMLPPPYVMTSSPPPSYGGTSTAMTMYSQGPSSGYGGYGAPVMLSKCQGCGGVGVDVAEKNGFCGHCNRLRLDFIVASAQIRRRCMSCGGWGLQFVQASGKCQHCERQEKLHAAGGFQQSVSSLSTQKLEAAAKTQEQDNDEDWDESSDEGSDWDD